MTDHTARNPFVPGFGVPPSEMVGRSDLMRDLREGLESGPRDERYTSILLGTRGSGKTATLNAVEAHAQRAGWLVMSVDASTDGLPDRVIQAVAWARDHHEGAESADPDAGHRGGGYSVRLPAGLGWGASRPALARPDWDMRHHLAGLASHAAALGSGVLLTVDEVHAGDREEIRRLAGDLQHITKRGQMPLAFLAAGLSVLEHTLLSDNRMTFFQRCARFTMPPLTLAEAVGGLRRTVRLGGGRIDDDALLVAAEATGPLPYKLQLVGHHAWTVSAAPDEPINLGDAKLAATLAAADFKQKIAIPAWDDLRRSDQQYLKVVVSLGDAATRRDIASLASADPSALSRSERRLRALGYVELSDDGTVSMTGILTPDVVQEAIDAEAGYTINSTKRSRCNEEMPRAKATCILPDGHTGRHRSK